METTTLLARPRGLDMERSEPEAPQPGTLLLGSNRSQPTDSLRRSV
jgi:hypothetical protein